MPVVNTMSDLISNIDGRLGSGLPIILNSLLFAGGVSKKISSRITTGATDSAGSVYRFARVRSSWRLESIGIINDALGAGASYRVGLYASMQNGGAAVSNALFNAALSLSNANATPQEQLFVELGCSPAEQVVWQLLGLNSDPLLDYDLCLAAVTPGPNAGDVAVRVSYVDGYN